MILLQIRLRREVSFDNCTQTVLLDFFCCCFNVDLMKLKRVNEAKKSKDGGGKKSDALISRFAAGFCFDVHPNDSNV